MNATVAYKHETFTRAQVMQALASALDDVRSTESDIRLLSELHVQMCVDQVGTIDAETQDDKIRRLLDFFVKL